jgi:hypothetical protein
LSGKQFLLGAGLGLLLDEPFDIEGLNIRLEYGFPFFDLRDQEENIQDYGENIQDYGWYFGVFYQP